jgi:hypothetical protein
MSDKNKNYPIVLTPEERKALIRAIATRRYQGVAEVECPAVSEEEEAVLDHLLHRLGADVNRNDKDSGSGVWYLDVTG